MLRRLSVGRFDDLAWSDGTGLHIRRELERAGKARFELDEGRFLGIALDHSLGRTLLIFAC